jgi:hypothetical protein
MSLFDPLARSKRSEPFRRNASVFVRVEQLEDRTTPSFSTATEVTADPISVVQGAPVALSVTVTNTNPDYATDENPSGQVNVYLDDTQIETVPLSPQPLSVSVSYADLKLDTGTFGPGPHTAKAVYDGDSSKLAFDASQGSTGVTITSPSVPPSVPPAASPTTTVVSANPAVVAVGAKVILTATVTAVTGANASSPTGPVSFSLGDTALGTLTLAPGPSASATATMTVATGTFGVGTYTVMATYAGDGAANGYQASSGTGSVTFASPVAPQVPPPPPVNHPLAHQPPLPPLPTAGTGVRLTAVGADAGSPGTVTVYNADGTKRFDLAPYGSDFTGGVRVAVGDVNGDGVPDVATVPGPGRPVQVRVFSGTDGQALWEQDVFEASFTGGAFVSAGDLTGDGKADVIVSPDEGGGPRVRVLSGADQSVVADFYGISDPNFRGGARTTTGDFNADGNTDLAVVAGFGGGPRVAVFNGASVTGGQPDRLVNDFFVFEQSLRNGVYVAAGNVSGGTGDDLIFGGGPGGGPRVMALRGSSLTVGNTADVVANFFAGDPALRGGVRVAVGDPTGAGVADILAGIGPGGPAAATAYKADGTAEQTLSATPGGVFVGGSEAPVQAATAIGGTRPLSAITIAGRFIRGAATRVVFSDQKGFRADVPAADVTGDDVRVGLPEYLDPATGQPAGGQLTAAVIQTPTGGGDVYSGAFPVRIDAPPATSMTPGEYTRALLTEASDRIALGATQAEDVAFESGGQVDPAPIEDGVTPVLDELHRRIAQIDDVLSGGDGSAGYGDPSGGGLTLADLSELDRLLAAASGGADLSLPDAAFAAAGRWLDSGDVGGAVSDYAAEAGVVESVGGFQGVGTQSAFAGLANAVFEARPVAQMVQTGTGMVAAGDISPAEAARLVAPQYDNQYRSVVQQTTQAVTPSRPQATNPFAGLGDRATQYVNGPTNSVSGWNGQQSPQATSDSGRLYRTWKGHKDYGVYALDFMVSLSPGGVKVVVQGQVNTQTPVGYGSGNIEVTGKHVSAPVVTGQWQSVSNNLTSIDHLPSTDFAADLNDDGSLTAYIHSDPVRMQPM